METKPPIPRAILVSVQIPGVDDIAHAADLEELGRLVKTLGYEVVGTVSQKRDDIGGGTVLGKGRLAELAAMTGGTGVVGSMAIARKSKARDRFEDAGEKQPDARETEPDLRTRAEIVIVDHDISPSQARNLERATGAQVLDRTGVIVEIFHRHAHSREAKLQVEMARLKYVSPRLRESSGGGRQQGVGAGESDLELDRRKIRDRLAELKQQLEDVERDNDQRRSARRDQLRVALVGYTNAGKSTLFNRLTRADVQAADMLFATLDPTLRALSLPHGGKAMLSDTVGFISNLPTQLVAAFRATLEEVLEADIILHVRDIAHEDADAQQRDVDTVLRQLGIDPDAGMRVLEVWNKIDCFDPEQRENLRNIAARRPSERPCFLVSAETGEGVDALLAAIEDRLAATRMTLDLSIDAADGAGISWLHRNSEILNKEFHDGRFDMTVRVDETKRDIVVNRFDAVPHAM